ncbi:MAG: (d)CMP kinase [Proteobacteria bacterium]|nr:MAG: (d)CMP kinase [Pseudomonadota bacterium]
MSPPIITIDGPSGTGKGTLAIHLTRRMGWRLLDSGALYRVVAYQARRQGIALDATSDIVSIATDLPLEFRQFDDNVQIRLDGDDVTDEIRSEVIGNGASVVAAVPLVRSALLVRQRGFLQPPGLIADGRDMGTVVFPSAELKIFLTARPAVRAERRYKQLKQKGIGVNLARLSEDIEARDRRDERREVSPLQPASDAIILDTTALDIAAVEGQVYALARERGLVAA